MDEGVSVFRHAAAVSGRVACPETGASDQKAWYAIHTRSRAEFQVRDRLTAKGIAVFFPSLDRPSQRRNQRITVTRPLFRCYLFARAERRELVAVTGVSHVSGPLADEDLAEIRHAVMPGNTGGFANVRGEGESVTVARGPFAGITGVITRLGPRRLVIRAAILGRPCVVEIGAGDVFGRRAAA
ncbi:MAG TPA: transcription termination/antitermination NusG family protein [Casimicrobiaceae bacterium]|jgi:transcription antitermination factor NusG|nr:transcription termination/antitermination NusG family protein [Casimicrobiaceae bacterium]